MLNHTQLLDLLENTPLTELEPVILHFRRKEKKVRPIGTCDLWSLAQDIIQHPEEYKDLLPFKL